jgi:hypothetical protein
MAKKRLERADRLKVESILRSIMTDYPHIQDPILKAKARSKVKKLMDEFDLTPYPGYHVLPDYMNE